MSIRKHNKSRRGLTSMEFALILPILVVLVMAIIEAGTMFSAWMTIQKAAQSGARYAATGIGDDGGDRVGLIVLQTEKWLESLNGGKEIVVKSWPTPEAAGDGVAGDAGPPCGLVEVSVTYGYEPITPVFEAMFPDDIELNGRDRKLNEPWKPCDG